MSTVTTEGTAVRLTRTISAPPERVYRAWLDPELLRRWLAPGTMTVTRAEVDERPGGRLSIHQADATEAGIGGMESDILELEPNRRIVFTWRFVGPQRELDPALDSRLTVTFAPVDEGTELTLVHERLDALFAAMPHLTDKVEPGWALVLDKLGAIA
jgi:uncharacterized protein YndB with AHSA1/START domain